MKIFRKLGSWILGVLATILGILAITKKNSNQESELDERKAKIEEKLDEIGKKEEKLEEKIEEGFSDKEILDYWEDKSEN